MDMCLLSARVTGMYSVPIGDFEGFSAKCHYGTYLLCVAVERLWWLFIISIFLDLGTYLYPGGIHVVCCRGETMVVIPDGNDRVYYFLWCFNGGDMCLESVAFLLYDLGCSYVHVLHTCEDVTGLCLTRWGNWRSEHLITNE